MGRHVSLSKHCRPTRFGSEPDCLASPSSLGQSHASAYRRSLAVSSTTISYSVYVVILGCIWDSNLIGCFRFINVIKGRKELTLCSSLMHSHMFPWLDVLYRQVGNLSIRQWRVPNFVMAASNHSGRHSGSWEHNDISVRFRAYLSIWSIIPTETSKLCSQPAVNAWSRALWLAGLGTRDI